VFRLLWSKQVFTYRGSRPQLYIPVRAPEDEASDAHFIFKKVETAEARRGALQQGRRDTKFAPHSLTRLSGLGHGRKDSEAEL
jgi:hypothetical protein